MLTFWGLPVLLIDQVFPALGFHVVTTTNAMAIEHLVFPRVLPKADNDNDPS